MPEVPSDWTLEPLKPGEQQLLQRLLQLYLYDFSEIEPADLDEEGLFNHHWLERYGREQGHHALLLRVAGKPAGFVLIDEGMSTAGRSERHFVQDFHVVRGYRGEGYGRAMAWSVFDRFPGAWRVEQVGPNVDAQAFWRRVIHEYTGGRFAEFSYQGEHFTVHVQEFDTSDRETG